jgi:predicted LPLAT superfamily acyltransferase
VTPPPGHWAGIPEKGSNFWLGLMLFCYRYGGRFVVRAVLAFVIAWYWLFASKARRASRDYLRRLHEWAGPTSPFARAPGAVASYRHFLAFGTSAVDKIAGWMGEVPAGELVIHGHPHLQALYGKGALVVGSHFGNLELLRAAMSGGPQAANVLVHTRHAERFNRLLTRANPRAAVRLIQVGDIGMDGAIHLQDRLDAGEWLVIAADRTPVQSSRILRADFLGASAAFPEGPWRLAALLKCPVLLVFCYRVQGRHEVHIQPFRERLELPRGARQEALALAIAEYSRALEQHCTRAPYQWFNFYDFWMDTP